MKQPKFVKLGLAAATISLFGGQAQAGDSEAAAREKLQTCVACHGADGIGKAPSYPNLRGQKAAYLEAQLKAFRSGDRVAPNMSRMARDLSDADIEYIAEFYARLASE